MTKEAQTTHYADCWKAHPACCRARLDEALHLLEGSVVAIEGLLLDRRYKDNHPHPAAGARAFLEKMGCLVYDWKTGVSTNTTPEEG